MNMKWVWIILLIVVGIVAAVFAYEYLSTGIGHLPSWVPGNEPHKRGHEHKRGYLCAIIAVVAFVGAGWMIYKERLTGKSVGSGGAAGPATT